MRILLRIGICGGNTDKKAMIEKNVREAHEKVGFSGTWLYAEKGEIVSKGATGENDPEKVPPVDCSAGGTEPFNNSISSWRVAHQSL